MTVVQRSSNVGSINISLAVILMFAIALLKYQISLNRYVSAVIYHCSLTGSASVSCFTIYAYFQNDIGNK